MEQARPTNMWWAWPLGALLWITGAAIEVVEVPQGMAYVAFEALWIAAHLAILLGLVTLGRLRPHGARRLGTIALKVAIVGRLIFLTGEADCLRTGTNTSVLLPIAAVITMIGMLLFGVSVARSGRWEGWRRFAPISMGIYPLLAMFPLAAATGEPPSAAIGGWAITFVAIGLACKQETHRRHLPSPKGHHAATPETPPYSRELVGHPKR